MKSTLQWIALLIARLSDAVQCIAFNPVIHSLLSCSLTDVGKLVGMCLFCCILFAKNGQFYWIFHGTKSCITLVESTIISCKRGLELWGPGKWLILWKILVPGCKIIYCTLLRAPLFLDSSSRWAHDRPVALHCLPHFLLSHLRSGIAFQSTVCKKFPISSPLSITSKIFKF